MRSARHEGMRTVHAPGVQRARHPRICRAGIWCLYGEPTARLGSRWASICRCRMVLRWGGCDRTRGPHLRAIHALADRHQVALDVSFHTQKIVSSSASSSPSSHTTSSAGVRWRSCQTPQNLVRPRYSIKPGSGLRRLCLGPAGPLESVAELHAPARKSPRHLCDLCALHRQPSLRMWRSCTRDFDGDVQGGSAILAGLL